MVNDPAVVPDENVYYPYAPTPARVDPPYETFEFSVQGPPAVDNGRLTVHIEWSNPANDWDLFVLNESGAIVAQSAAFGDANEDAVIVDPVAGRYTAVIVNYDQVSRQLDDWTGQIRFASPTLTTSGPKETWTLRCETPANTKTQQLIVDRGQTLDLGPTACPSA
jgi:hypothetical protein